MISCAHATQIESNGNKLIFKANDKSDEVIKLIHIAAYEDSIPKFAAKHCKKCIANGMELIDKAHFKSCNG